MYTVLVHQQMPVVTLVYLLNTSTRKLFETFFAQLIAATVFPFPLGIKYLHEKGKVEKGCLHIRFGAWHWTS